MSYRGIVVPLPVGQQGFTGTANPSQAGPGHLLYTDGAELQANVIRKEGGAAKFNANAVAGPDAFTKILLHMNGVGTNFIDSSPSPKIFTAAGGAVLSSAQFRFGGASFLGNGTDAWISCPDTSDITLVGDWAIDTVFMCTAAGGTIQRLAGQCDSGPSATLTSFRIQRTAANVIFCRVCVGAGNFDITGTTQFTDVLNPGLHHLAFICVGNVLRMFLDGVQEGGDVALVGTINDVSQILSIGQQGAITTNPWTGYIDEFRISVGSSRWTVGFTPPVLEYPNAGVGGGAGAGEAVVSGINWSPTPGNRRDLVFTAGGRILKDTGAGTFNTTMVSGLVPTRDPPPWFALGGGEAVGSARHLFLFSATNQVQVAVGDANTMANIASPAADWTGAGNFPTFGLMHDFRLWAGGNASDPHRLYYSTIANHEDFVTGGGASGSIAVFPSEGERIVGATSFRGALVVFKYPQGIYIISTSDPSPSNWGAIPLTRAVGSLNQHTIIQIENDVLYLDVAGSTHALSTTQEFGDYKTSDIGYADSIYSFMKTYVNVSLLRRAQGIWYGRRQQAWWALPLLGSTDNNMRFITLVETQTPTPNNPTPAPVRRFFMSRRDVCIAMWLKPDPNEVPSPMVGDNAGFIWKLDQDTRSKDGAGYPIAFETANTDFGFYNPELATRMKAGQFLEIAYEPRGNWDLTVEVFWDDILTDVILFNMGAGGATLGSFILDTDVLASSVVKSVRSKMNGSGRRLRLAASNSGLGQDISLASFYVHMGIMDERTDN